MPWNEITLEPHKPLTRQLTEQIRDLIRFGRIQPGQKLPSYPELAQIMSLPPSTVNNALRPLVKEGLLDRRQRHGTFVRERPHELKTIGLYYSGGILSHPAHRFYRALHECLMQRIGQSGRRWMMWNDPRPAEEAAAPWAELEEASRRGEIGALIVPCMDLMHYGWLSKLPLPSAFVGAASIPNRVGHDNRQLAELAVSELARQGCRTIGLISAMPAVLRKPSPLKEDLLDAYEGFKVAMSKRGLRTRDAWIIAKEQDLAVPSCERWGYEAFARLWDQPERPEGLVVFTDVEAAGVTTAILERGIHVPRDLRLAYQKNAEVDFLCPLQVTHIVSRADDMAQALIEMVEKQYRGEKVELTNIGFSVAQPHSKGGQSDE